MLSIHKEQAQSGQETFPWQELAEISLWASGDASLSGMEKIKTIVTALSTAINPAASGKEKADFILNRHD